MPSWVRMTLASVTWPLALKCSRSCSVVKCLGRFLMMIREDMAAALLPPP